MSPRFAQSRRAEAFAAALDGDAGRLDAELAALVELVGAVRSVPLVTPGAPFAARLRERLLTAAADELEPVPVLPHQPGSRRRVTPPQRGPRRVAVAATSLILAGGGLGIANASTQALPGDLLYPVKRGGEQLDLALHSGVDADGRIRLEQATTRLDEVQGLLATRAGESGTDEYVTEALSDFSAAADDGASLLIESYGTQDDIEGLHELHGFLETSSQTLADLTGDVPASAVGELEEAARLLARLDGAAKRACASCGFGDITPAVDDVLEQLDALVEAGQELPPGSLTSPGKEAADRPDGRSPGQDSGQDADGDTRDGDDGDGPEIEIQLPGSDDPTQQPPDDDGPLPTEVTVDLPLPDGDDSGDPDDSPGLPTDLPTITDLPTLPDLELP